MRHGFILYEESASILLSLPAEKAGEVIQRASRYFIDGSDPFENVDPAILYPLKYIVSKMDEDADAYERKVTKRKEAAEKRWSDANAMQNDANASKCNAKECKTRIISKINGTNKSCLG